MALNDSSVLHNVIRRSSNHRIPLGWTFPDWMDDKGKAFILNEMKSKLKDYQWEKKRDAQVFEAFQDYITAFTFKQC
jgi:hypothetical protein